MWDHPIRILGLALRRINIIADNNVGKTNLLESFILGANPYEGALIWRITSSRVENFEFGMFKFLFGDVRKSIEFDLIMKTIGTRSPGKKLSAVIKPSHTRNTETLTKVNISGKAVENRDMSEQG